MHPLQEVLLAGRIRHQELLVASLGQAVSGALQEDPLKPLRVALPAAGVRPRPAPASLPRALMPYVVHVPI